MRSGLFCLIFPQLLQTNLCFSHKLLIQYPYHSTMQLDFIEETVATIQNPQFKLLLKISWNSTFYVTLWLKKINLLIVFTTHKAEMKKFY
jgi:hypothetical protein